MGANKGVRGSKGFTNIGSGNYEVAYRKDGGAWIIINELQVNIPTGRNGNIQIMIVGEEFDA